MGVRESDIDVILAHRYDNGADFWATSDGRIYVCNPFSTISSLGILHELDAGSDHEAVQGGLALIRDAWREDGRIRLGPKSPLYPCYTAEAARVLCRFGQAGQEMLERTITYLLENDHETGGWRCDFRKFGHGPETEYANPGATLFILDVLRFFPEYRQGDKVVDRAVESLLDHWEIRKPIGPCHYGIGSLFMQVEYPFLRYNLFLYVYVLSFFQRAKEDSRFRSALKVLNSKLSESGEVIVERPHRGLRGLQFCARGQPSASATKRYREILQNLG